MVTSCGVASRALSALAGENIEIALITTSDLDISLLIRQQDEDAAACRIDKSVRPVIFGGDPLHFRHALPEGAARPMQASLQCRVKVREG